MRLLEHQGKELFVQYGIPTPKSALATSLTEVEKLSTKFEFPLILKSQVAVGGRGKAGGIVRCNTPIEAASKFRELVNKRIKGELPRSIMIEQSVDIKQEIYISLFLNRGRRIYSLICSPEGGVDIESVKNKLIIDVPTSGVSLSLATETASKLGLQGRTAESFNSFVINLSKLVFEKDAELAEINPAVVLRDASLLALDAKVIIDDNAMFRHPELKKYQYMSETEKQAKEGGFSFIELDGNIAIIGNGAGLVMSTLDMVSDQGGKAGCFLDFGGSATAETIYESLRIISKITKIRAILINLFGGIVKTNVVAEGILRAYRESIIEVPTFARISGAEANQAKKMLKDSKAKIYDTVEQAIQGVLAELSKKEEIYGKSV
jgi:succinyl-CoA synthetase beta subunit